MCRVHDDVCDIGESRREHCPQPGFAEPDEIHLRNVNSVCSTAQCRYNVLDAQRRCRPVVGGEVGGILLPLVVTVFSRAEDINDEQLVPECEQTGEDARFWDGT